MPRPERQVPSAPSDSGTHAQVPTLRNIHAGTRAIRTRRIWDAAQRPRPTSLPIWSRRAFRNSPDAPTGQTAGVGSPGTATPTPASVGSPTSTPGSAGLGTTPASATSCPASGTPPGPHLCHFSTLHRHTPARGNRARASPNPGHRFRRRTSRRRRWDSGLEKRR